MVIRDDQRKTARVKPFSMEDHGEEFARWLSFYNRPLSFMNQIPCMGFIVEDDEGLIAAAFLRKIEGCGAALFDGLIANPQSSGKRRYFAIDLLSREALRGAKDGGFQSVIAFSVDKGTLKRSIKHGFRRLPHDLITLDLK